MTKVTFFFSNMEDRSKYKYKHDHIHMFPVVGLFEEIRGGEKGEENDRE
jgi:hypothetical protein